MRKADFVSSYPRRQALEALGELDRGDVSGDIVRILVEFLSMTGEAVVARAATEAHERIYG